jgi:hypothetical protein
MAHATVDHRNMPGDQKLETNVSSSHATGSGDAHLPEADGLAAGITKRRALSMARQPRSWTKCSKQSLLARSLKQLTLLARGLKQAAASTLTTGSTVAAGQRKCFDTMNRLCGCDVHAMCVVRALGITWVHDRHWSHAQSWNLAQRRFQACRWLHACSCFQCCYWVQTCSWPLA